MTTEDEAIRDIEDWFKQQGYALHKIEADNSGGYSVGYGPVTGGSGAGPYASGRTRLAAAQNAQAKLKDNLAKRRDA